MSTVVFLTGPTCTGKSALALALAERHGAEIVGADSRQIYRGMEIGTAAPTAEDRARVPHHLVGFLDPYERYSAARFVDDALAAIDAIHARAKRALVVGGTGFYVRALAGDVTLSDAYDEDIRERLARECEIHPPEFLHGWLALRAPQRAAELEPTDRYRIARALEIALAAPGTQARAAASLRQRGIPSRKFVLDVDDSERDARIAARTDAMLAAGLVEEAERIGPDAVAADAVGYPQALAYLAGRATFAELRALLARATRRYAKRQRTWFRTEPDVTYLADLPVPAIEVPRRGVAKVMRVANVVGAPSGAQRGQLQDSFLAEVKRQEIAVTVYLVNGFQLRGMVKGYDSFTIVLEYEHRPHLIYKHAVSTISPSAPLTLPE